MTVFVRCVVGGVLLAALASPAAAQYSATSWTTEQGLPQNSVIAIAQTPDGFLWITTLGGLARFDGRTFTTFDTTTNPELPHTRFGGVVVDGDGQLWVTLQTGQLMRLTSGRFEVMGRAHGLPADTITQMGVRDGRLMADTAGGLATWTDGRFAVDPALQPPAEARNMTFVGVARGRRARWYRDGTGRAHRFEPGAPSRSVDLPGHSIYEDRSGRVWSLVPQTGELVALTAGQLQRFGAAAGQFPMQLMAVMEQPDGSLWFGAPRGLNRFQDGRFTTITPATGLPDPQVRALFLDREGSVWVGTNRGLARLVRQSIVSITAADGLAADNTYPVLETRDGAVWIGGWPGLTRYQNGVMQSVADAYGLTGENVLSLMEDRDGVIWVGTIGAGVVRIAGGRAVEVPGSQAIGAVHVIVQARGSPDIWMGTADGVVRYRDGTFTRLRRADRVLGGETSIVFEDASHTLWVGNIHGLARVVDGQLVQVPADTGFTGNRVRAVHQDDTGTLWFGTYDTGLFRYRDGRFTRFTAREGLPTNGAFRILEDDQRRFWISSNVGIYRVDREALDAVADGRRRTVMAVVYGREDGMANQECNGLGQPSGIRARDGRLWFPTQRGVVVLDPVAMSTNTLPPPVSILDVSVGGFPTAERSRIEIRSPRAEFRARYAALTFVRPELARFRYRMEGLDAEWIEAGTDRTVRYADLPYGSFRFRVIAANRDGVWNEEGAALDVIVIPPFYRTTWFAGLLVGIVGLVTYAAHRSQVRAVERRRATQEAFTRQLIDTQETDRRRIAAELHDGVSQTLVVMKNWAQFGQHALPDDSPVRKKLGDIADAAAQALGEVREVVHDLVPYHLERQGLVASIRESAVRMGEAAGIEVECRTGAVDGRLSAQAALRLFRVVQEGMNNVVKHSGATRVQLDLSADATHVRCVISDNGRGFDPHAVTPTTPGGGFGLVGMTERARMMAGDLTISSSPGRGTVVTIVVPASQTQEQR